jgi:hypothetical protein
MKCKISYSGFAYVEADNEDEAQMAYEDGDTVYEEELIETVEEVDEFTVMI